jgi:hypothetical protein
MSKENKNLKTKSLSVGDVNESIFPWYEGAFCVLAPIFVSIPLGFLLKFNSNAIVISAFLGVLSQLTVAIFGPFLALVILSVISYGACQFFGVENYIQVGFLAIISIPLIWSFVNFLDSIAKKLKFKFR